LNVFPGSILGKLFIAVGFPLGSLIFLATPEGFLRELAPQGGPDAIGWAIAIGALITWFTLFFFMWFVAIALMRSNTTPHADARDMPAHTSGNGARAGGRER